MRAPYCRPSQIASTLLALISLLLLLACGGAGGTSPNPNPPNPNPPPPQAQTAKTYVYLLSENVGTVGPGAISGFSQAADGSLALVPGSPVAFPSGPPQVLAADPNGKFIFAAGLNGIQTLAITPSTGALTLTSSTLAGGKVFAQSGMAVDKNGAFLYATTSTGVNVFSIAADGSLTKVQTVPFTVGGPLALDPVGGHLYASRRNHTTIFNIDPTAGTLSELGITTSLANDQNAALAVDPAGKALYVQSRNTQQTLVYGIDEGSLSLLQTANCGCVSDEGGGSIAITPDGKFLYETTNVSRALIGMTIGIDGTLTPLAFNAAAATEPQNTTAVALSPDGKFLIAPVDTPGAANTLAVFSVDPNTGAITPVTGSPFAIDTQGDFFPASVVTASVPQ